MSSESYRLLLISVYENANLKNIFTSLAELSERSVALPKNVKEFVLVVEKNNFGQDQQIECHRKPKDKRLVCVKEYGA